jgi:hypothetical protein
VLDDAVAYIIPNINKVVDSTDRPSPSGPPAGLRNQFWKSKKSSREKLLTVKKKAIMFAAIT